MNGSNKFSPGVRERTVRLAQGHGQKCPSRLAALHTVASTIGCMPQTLSGLDQALRGR